MAALIRMNDSTAQHQWQQCCPSGSPALHQVNPGVGVVRAKPRGAESWLGVPFHRNGIYIYLNVID